MKRLTTAMTVLAVLAAPSSASAAGCLFDAGADSQLRNGQLRIGINGVLLHVDPARVVVDVTVSRAGRVVRYERDVWQVAPVEFGGVATYTVPRAWKSVGVRLRIRTWCGVVVEHLDVTRRGRR